MGKMIVNHLFNKWIFFISCFLIEKRLSLTTVKCWYFDNRKRSKLHFSCILIYLANELHYRIYQFHKLLYSTVNLHFTFAFFQFQNESLIQATLDYKNLNNFSIIFENCKRNKLTKKAIKDSLFLGSHLIVMSG